MVNYNYSSMNSCKVSFYECPAHFPFCLARHSWIVIHEWSLCSRYEVLWKKDGRRNSHIFVNAFEMTQGINRIPFIKNKFFSKSSFIGSIDWEIAKQMISVIKESVEIYPYKSIYKFTWPNSNTYTQWVLDKTKHSPLKLSWNAFWKSFIV